MYRSNQNIVYQAWFLQQQQKQRNLCRQTKNMSDLYCTRPKQFNKKTSY